MDNTTQFKKQSAIQSDKLTRGLDEALDALSPEQRASVEKLAAELVKDKDFREAAEIIKENKTLKPALDDAKFVGELGWLTALASVIAIIAIP